METNNFLNNSSSSQNKPKERFKFFLKKLLELRTKHKEGTLKRKEMMAYIDLLHKFISHLQSPANKHLDETVSILKNLLSLFDEAKKLFDELKERD